MKLTIGECAKKTNLTDRIIRELCINYDINAEKQSDNTWLIDIKSLKEYINNHPYLCRNSTRFLGNKNYIFGDIYVPFNEVLKPITSYLNDEEIFNLDRYEMKYSYFVSNCGNVYSTDTGIKLKPDCKEYGHQYVNLTFKTGIIKHVYIHRLVAYFFCHNKLCKNYVHHLNKNPHDNRARNLLWVTDAQHKRLHKLYNSDRKAYWSLVSEIRRENK